MVEARKQFGQMIDGQMPQSPQIRKLRRVTSEQDSDIIVPPKQDDAYIDSTTPLDIGNDTETAELEAFSRKKTKTIKPKTAYEQRRDEKHEQVVELLESLDATITATDDIQRATIEGPIEDTGIYIPTVTTAKKRSHHTAPSFSKERLNVFDQHLDKNFSTDPEEPSVTKKQQHAPKQSNIERIGAQITDIEHHIAHTKDFMTRLDPTNDVVRIERYKKQLIALEQTKEKLMGKILENQPVHISDFQNDKQQHSGSTPEKTPRMSSTSEREALAISHTIQFPSYENSDAKTAVYTGDIITKELMNLYRLSPDDKLTLSRDTRFPQLLDEAIKNKRQHGGITDITTDVLIPFLFDYIQSTQEEIRAEKEREQQRKKGIFERIGNIFRRATPSPLEARLLTLLKLDEQVLKHQSKNK